MKLKLLIAAFLAFCSIDAGASDVVTEEVVFSNNGTALAGSIVYPKNAEVSSAVVFVHGSGKQTRNVGLAKAFASSGIAALVYDKRGVGHSEGEYEEKRSVGEHNLKLLASDASAAINALKRHKLLSNTPIGLVGISQAGWIVPLAAESNPNVDFIALWSGPVCKVSEEDIYSKYTKDIDRGRLPVFREALAARDTEYIWPTWLGKDLDPSEALRSLDIPGLWIYGGQDGSIPVQLSISRLKRLIESDNTEYSYIYFSALGHNNIEPTFGTVVNWIKGR